MSKKVVYITSMSASPFTFKIRTRQKALYDINIPDRALNNEISFNDEYEYQGFLASIKAYLDEGIFRISEKEDKKIVKHLEKDEEALIKQDEKKRAEDMKKIDNPISQALQQNVGKDKAKDLIQTTVTAPDGKVVDSSISSKED